MKWKRRKVAKKRRAWRKLCEKIRNADRRAAQGRFHSTDWALAI